MINLLTLLFLTTAQEVPETDTPGQRGAGELCERQLDGVWIPCKEHDRLMSGDQCLSIKQAKECQLNIYSEQCFGPFLKCFDGLSANESLSSLDNQMDSIKTVFNF